MSPHRIETLPSRAALSQYGISKNGFLPKEAPLERLPQACYQPWERIIEDLPKLIEEQEIREKVDALPVLDTAQLSSEAEWQRACSLLALIAQGYIWTGPEPSQVGCLGVFVKLLLTRAIATSSCHNRSIAQDVRTSGSAPDNDVRHIEPLELAGAPGGRRHHTARQFGGSTNGYGY